MGGALCLRRAAPSPRALGAGASGLRPPWEALPRWPKDTGLSGKRADPPTPMREIRFGGPRPTRLLAWGSSLGGLLQDPACPYVFLHGAPVVFLSDPRCSPAALFWMFPPAVSISSGPASPLSPWRRARAARAQSEWKDAEQCSRTVVQARKDQPRQQGDRQTDLVFSVRIHQLFIL